MAKRLINAGIFQDSWFEQLGKDAKLLFVYIFTNCDHAGVIEVNYKRWEFDTGIDVASASLSEIKDRYIPFDNGKKLFDPAFVYFQYPNWPRSKVRAQDSAKVILDKYGLLNADGTVIDQAASVNKPFTYSMANSSLTVSEPLANGIKHINEEVVDDEILIGSSKPVRIKPAGFSSISEDAVKVLVRLREWFDFTAESKLDLQVASRLSQIERVGMMKRFMENTLAYIRDLELKGSLRYRVDVKNWLGLDTPGDFRSAGKWNDGTKWVVRYEETLGKIESRTKQFGAAQSQKLKGGLQL